MKIKDWKELDGLQHDDLMLSVEPNYNSVKIIIKKKDTPCPAVIGITSTNEQRIAILKLFGFDIELTEPLKLTKRERALCEYLPADWWVTKNKNGEIYATESKPERLATCWEVWGDALSIIWVKFPFLNFESEPIQVSDLLKLEVSDE